MWVAICPKSTLIISPVPYPLFRSAGLAAVVCLPKVPAETRVGTPPCWNGTFLCSSFFFAVQLLCFRRLVLFDRPLPVRSPVSLWEECCAVSVNVRRDLHSQSTITLAVGRRHPRSCRTPSGSACSLTKRPLE